jgi:hypothetical protein
MFIKANVPILKIMILFMEAYKCVPIVMQMGWQYGWLEIHIKVVLLLGNGVIN